MFRAVIFDLGGVVFPSPFEAFDNYDATAGLERGTVRALIRTSSETGAWAALERGELTMDQFRSALESEAQAAGFTLDGIALLGSFGNGTGARPSMLTAIARIREHGLRVGALTNNWAAPDGRSEPNAFHSPDLRRRRRVEHRGHPQARPAHLRPRPQPPRRRGDRSRVPRRPRDQPQTGARTRHDDDQGGRPRRRARRTRSRSSASPLREALMEIVWVRHAEPERIETGTGVPANPPLTAGGRVQAERVAVVARGRAGRRRSVESAATRPGDRGADRRGTRARGRDRRGSGRVRRAGRPLHPDGGTARREGRAVDCDARRPVG